MMHIICVRVVLVCECQIKWHWKNPIIHGGLLWTMEKRDTKAQRWWERSGGRGSCPLGSTKNNVRFVRCGWTPESWQLCPSFPQLYSFPSVHCPLLLTSISACAKFIRLPSVCAAHKGSPILLALEGSAKGPGLTQQWVFSVSGFGSLLPQLNTPQCFC